MPRRAGTVILTGAALLLTAYLASRVAAPRHTEPVDASTDHRPLGSMYAGSFEERVTLAPAEAPPQPDPPELRRQATFRQAVRRVLP